MASKANGKVILLGEHAVVYGMPAIAAGIDRGAAARVLPSSEAALIVNGVQTERTDEALRALQALCDVAGSTPVTATVDLELPAGCGLGASAAMGVAIAHAVLTTQAETDRAAVSNDAVLDAAMAWERVFHGNPSGIDAAAAWYGGCLRFVRDVGISAIPLEQPLTLAIGVAGPPASTKSMVDSVAKLKERRPELVQKTLHGIESLVNNAELCLRSHDLEGLGKLMDYNQMLLSGLFVSTEDIERACRLAREAGALGAKLTGAGGGGAVVALVQSDPEPVLKAWRSSGMQCFAARVTASHAAP